MRKWYFLGHATKGVAHVIEGEDGDPRCGSKGEGVTMQTPLRDVCSDCLNGATLTSKDWPQKALHFFLETHRPPMQRAADERLSEAEIACEEQVFCLNAEVLAGRHNERTGSEIPVPLSAMDGLVVREWYRWGVSTEMLHWVMLESGAVVRTIRYFSAPLRERMKTLQRRTA